MGRATKLCVLNSTGGQHIIVDAFYNNIPGQDTGSYYGSPQTDLAAPKSSHAFFMNSTRTAPNKGIIEG